MPPEEKKTNELETYDLALATFLDWNGMKHRIDRTHPPRVCFHFTPKAKCEKLAKDYYYHRANLKAEIFNE